MQPNPVKRRIIVKIRVKVNRELVIKACRKILMSVLQFKQSQNRLFNMYFSFERLRESDCIKLVIASFLFVYLISFSSLSEAVNTKLVIKGSTTILPIALDIGAEFQKRHPGVEAVD